MFSSRLPSRIGASALSQTVAAARAAGQIRRDLTETNPTRVGIAYPRDLADAFADEAALTYAPAAFGTLAARQAVAATSTSDVAPDHIILTASTSEAYSFLFKLLCDPGDEVLVPQPSYPLFDLLTTLDGVRPVAYRLDAAGGWCLDRESLLRGVTRATRAVLVVSPNNPTGSVLRRDDRDWLAGFACDHHLAVIADEVFADYPLALRSAAVSMAGETRALTFTLGGLSKSVGLPQMKLAWTMVSGPDELVTGALERLEIIADSYLSVSTPVQVAVPRILAAGRQVQRAIHERVRRNLASLRAAVGAVPSLTLYEPDGGWSAVVRVPAILSEEEWVLRLLHTHGVLVHPGYFFDLDAGVHLVVSLLPEPETFDGGTAAVAELVRSLAS
jgi:alanine-synthesizing transaminase